MQNAIKIHEKQGSAMTTLQQREITLISQSNELYPQNLKKKKNQSIATIIASSKMSESVATQISTKCEFIVTQTST